MDAGENIQFCGNEMPDKETVISKEDEIPSETYEYVFSEEEFSEVLSYFKRRWWTKPIITTLLAVVAFELIGAIIGLLYFYICGAIILAYEAVFFSLKYKSYKKALRKVLEMEEGKTTVYSIFMDQMSAAEIKDGDIVCYKKFMLDEIIEVMDTGKLISLRTAEACYPIKKADIKENSVLNGSVREKAKVKKKQEETLRWRGISIFLLIAAIASPILGAVTIDPEKLWSYLLLASFPAASVILGFVLKGKTNGYKKNIIAGFAALLLLCIIAAIALYFYYILL